MSEGISYIVTRCDRQGWAQRVKEMPWKARMRPTIEEAEKIARERNPDWAEYSFLQLSAYMFVDGKYMWEIPLEGEE